MALFSCMISEDHLIKGHTTLCDQGLLRLHGKEPFKLPQHSSKFGSHRHSISRDIMILV